jgi:transcriptional regulator with XRE-family HTH domain
MTAKSFDDLYHDAETHDDYWIAGVVQDFTEALFRRMESEEISRSELARRLETSPAYVTKILRGNGNFTIATMVRLARAVGMELKVELYPQERSLETAPTRPTVLAT